jgi:cytochrome P450
MMDYLAEFDRARPADKYPLVHGWIKSEPLAFFKQLRAERPILVTPVCTLVTLFPDVRDLLQMPKIFTVDLLKPKMGVTGPNDGYLMAHDDDALHYREKSIMQGLLNREDLPRIRKLIEETAREILENADGSIEFVNDYCRTVPVRLVQDYFGLDGVSGKDLIEWSYWNQYDAFNNQPTDLLTEEQDQYIVERHAAVSEKLGVYIATVMLRKLVMIKTTGWLSILLSYPKRVLFSLLGMSIKPRLDNITTRMLRSRFAKEVDFPLVRIGINAGGLLIGAIETTQQAVSQVVEFFIQKPDLMRKAKQAARFEDRAEFDTMVWEALRFVPIRPGVFRTAAHNYTIAKGTEHETEVKKGTIVRLLTQSAMFDSFAYENPDEFNPQRTFYHNFNFGFGSHQCLGKYIGMVMIPEMVRQAILLPGLSDNGPINYERSEGPLAGKLDGPFPEKYSIKWGSSIDLPAVS